jgi:hypothetical protein
MRSVWLASERERTLAFVISIASSVLIPFTRRGCGLIHILLSNGSEANLGRRNPTIGSYGRRRGGANEEADRNLRQTHIRETLLSLLIEDLTHQAVLVDRRVSDGLDKTILIDLIAE